MFHLLKEQFIQAADPMQAGPMATYMKNRFPFLGIKKPERALIQKSIFKNNPLRTSDELIALMGTLWSQSEREFHYAACDLAIKYKNFLREEDLPFLEELLRTHSWWDSVDTITPHLVGNLVMRFPQLKAQMSLWIKDDNFWIRRAALLFQLKYKAKTDSDLLFQFCLEQASEKEFFIRKAIGWVLREYAKTEPEKVASFLAVHSSQLSPLSYREASKHFTA